VLRRQWVGLVATCWLLAVSVGAVGQMGTAVSPINTSGAASILITEIEVNGADDDDSSDAVDWVEICNTGTTAVSVGGWIVEAEVDSWSQWGGLRRSDPIPAETVLLPGECYVISRKDRWMTNDSTRSVRLYAEMALETGVRVMMLVDEAMWREQRENPYNHFVDNADDTRTLQLVDVSGQWMWLLREQTRGTRSDQPGS